MQSSIRAIFSAAGLLVFLTACVSDQKQIAANTDRPQAAVGGGRAPARFMTDNDKEALNAEAQHPYWATYNMSERLYTPNSAPFPEPVYDSRTDTFGYDSSFLRAICVGSDSSKGERMIHYFLKKGLAIWRTKIYFAANHRTSEAVIEYAYDKKGEANTSAPSYAGWDVGHLGFASYGSALSSLPKEPTTVHLYYNSRGVGEFLGGVITSGKRSLKINPHNLFESQDIKAADFALKSLQSWEVDQLVRDCERQRLL